VNLCGACEYWRPRIGDAANFNKVYPASKAVLDKLMRLAAHPGTHF